jgi:hypothetical protein
VPGGTPRSVIVTAVLAVLVTAGALGGAEVIRQRAAESGSTPATSQKPPASSVVGASGCLVEPCKVLARTTVGGTIVDLVADAGARSGRMRVGGPTSGSVFEATITERGVTLTSDSLQCIAGGPIACLIKGELDGGGIAGQIVVGRSDKWSLTEKTYLSVAGYLALANIDGDVAPEIVAAQHDCGNTGANCSARPVFVQVFAVAGKVLGCTKDYPRLDKLPGWPTVKITAAALTPCR